MSEKVLEPKAKAFALRIVRLYKLLKRQGETVISTQMLRSGTSIGANIAEAQYAQSRADFTTKLSIALKEASETRYWIELLVQSGYVADDEVIRSLLSECGELIRILVASTKTVKGKEHP